MTRAASPHAPAPAETSGRGAPPAAPPADPSPAPHTPPAEPAPAPPALTQTAQVPRPPTERPPLFPLTAGFVALAACLVLAAINEARGFDLWRNYALAGFFIGSAIAYLLWRFDMRVPQYIVALVGVAGMLHFGGGSMGSPDPYRMGLLGMHGVNGAYHVFGWWDHLTHFAGIGAATMGYVYLLDVYQLRRGLQWNGPTLWTLALLCGLTTGVATELYEYLGKTAFQTIDQGGYVNTMQDLLFNLYGGAVGATVAVTINRTALRRHIRTHWHVDAVKPMGGPLVDRVPPRIAGLVAFTLIPSVVALALAFHSLTIEIPEPDLPLYDPALNTLTASGVAAVLAFPAAVWLQRWRMARQEVA